MPGDRDDNRDSRDPQAVSVEDAETVLDPGRATGSGSRSSDSDAFDETEIATPTGGAGIGDTSTRPGLDLRESSVYGPGKSIGRFKVLELIGAGGMGIVLAAYDPQLDRRVAIKMLRKSVSETNSARLEREARAMARLSHPNVVTVHEVGTIDGRFFVAMEYVDGQTLGEWLRERPRSWAETTRILGDAGRGLAAAHRAGMVHRDFKPDNVLVGHDGRVRVSDFGLVSAIGQEVEVRPQAPRDDLLSSSSLTETGAVMGTPLYMAPEQHKGEMTDAKADQYSFCATLWEALFGQPPYRADTYPELLMQVMTGELREPPRDARVPGWIRAILERGLRKEPDERFPAMDALLAALSHDPNRLRMRLLAAAVIVAVIGIAIASTYHLVGGDGAPCEGAATNLRDVWDESRKRAVRKAFHATRAPYAGDAWRTVEAELSTYAANWVEMHAETCRATRVRGQQSEELFDLRMHCLDRRLSEVRALTSLFAEKTDEQVVRNAVQAVRGLRSLDACADAEGLRARVPLPDDPAARERIAALRARLDEAKSLERVGSYPSALEIAGEAAEQTAEIEYSPLRAEALLLRAGLLRQSGDYESAEDAYRESAAAAAEARADDLVARSWIDLIYALYQQGRLDEALSFSSVAETSAARVREDAKIQARLANNIGTVLLAEGKYEEALAQYEKALAIQREKLGAEDNPLLAPALANVGTALWYTGKPSDSRKYYERALAMLREDLGARHPNVAYTLRNLGDVHVAENDYDGAMPLYREAASIWEESLGPDHPNVAFAYEQLAHGLSGQGKHEQAIDYGKRALAIREKHFGPEHPLVAQVLIILGGVFLAMDDRKAAAEQYERALRLQGATLGADHPKVAYTVDRLADIAEAEGDHAGALGHRERSLSIRKKALGEHKDVAYSHFMLGMLLVDRKDYRGAEANFRRARAIWTAIGGADDPAVAVAIYGLAEVRRGQARYGAAIDLFEEALAMVEGKEIEAPQRESMQFGLAQALWEARRDRARARNLAEQARRASESGALREDRRLVASPGVSLPER